MQDVLPLAVIVGDQIMTAEGELIRHVLATGALTMIGREPS